MNNKKLTIALLLGVAIWRFAQVANRLPGGAERYIYLPIAMGALLVLALWRAWRLLQKARSPRRP